MGAYVPLERGVQKMGGGVVALGGTARLRVHFGAIGAGAELATARDLAAVHVEPLRLADRGDLELEPIGVGEAAAIPTCPPPSA